MAQDQERSLRRLRRWRRPTQLTDPAGPRVVNDPLWPLDALFGARDEVFLDEVQNRLIWAGAPDSPMQGVVVLTAAVCGGRFFRRSMSSEVPRLRNLLGQIDRLGTNLLNQDHQAQPHTLTRIVLR